MANRHAASRTKWLFFMLSPCRSSPHYTPNPLGLRLLFSAADPQICWIWRFFDSQSFDNSVRIAPRQAEARRLLLPGRNTRSIRDTEVSRQVHEPAAVPHGCAINHSLTRLT